MCLPMVTVRTIRVEDTRESRSYMVTCSLWKWVSTKVYRTTSNTNRHKALTAPKATRVYMFMALYFT